MVDKDINNSELSSIEQIEKRQEKNALKFFGSFKISVIFCWLIQLSGSARSNQINIQTNNNK